MHHCGHQFTPPTPQIFSNTFLSYQFIIPSDNIPYHPLRTLLIMRPIIIVSTSAMATSNVRNVRLTAYLLVDNVTDISRGYLCSCYVG